MLEAQGLINVAPVSALIAQMNAIKWLWAQWWWPVIMFVLGALPRWLPFVRDAIRPKYCGFVGPVILAPERLRCVAAMPNRQVASADLLIYVRLTNASNSAAEITDYNAELGQRFHWHGLTPLRLLEVELEHATPEGARVYWELSRLFEEDARRGIIQTGASVEGWMIFQMPRGTAGANYKKIKVTIRDSVGREVHLSTDLAEKPSTSVGRLIDAPVLKSKPEGWTPLWRNERDQ